MLWLIAPLFITAFLVQVYFGRHRQEELGWEGSYGNAIILIFTGVNLFYYLYRTYGYPAMITAGEVAFSKSLFVSIGFFYALVLLFIDFTHSINKRLAFFLCSSTIVSVSSFITIVLVYSSIPFDTITLLAAWFIFLVIFLFFVIFRSIIPPTLEAEQFLQQQKLKKMEKRRVLRLERQRKIKLFLKKIGERTENILHAPHKYR